MHQTKRHRINRAIRFVVRWRHGCAWEYVDQPPDYTVTIDTFDEQQRKSDDGNLNIAPVKAFGGAKTGYCAKIGNRDIDQRVACIPDCSIGPTIFTHADVLIPRRVADQCTNTRHCRAMHRARFHSIGRPANHCVGVAAADRLLVRPRTYAVDLERIELACRQSLMRRLRLNDKLPAELTPRPAGGGAAGNQDVPRSTRSTGAARRESRVRHEPWF